MNKIYLNYDKFICLVRHCTRHWQSEQKHNFISTGVLIARAVANVNGMQSTQHLSVCVSHVRLIHLIFATSNDVFANE